MKYDKAGSLEDERWEEISPDGHQARYRQNAPSQLFYVVDDRKTVIVYHAGKDKTSSPSHLVAASRIFFQKFTVTFLSA